MPLPHLRRMTLATLLAMAITGLAACGDDGGGPVAPTTPTTPVVDTRSDESAARQSVDAWLALLDAGNYAAAYDATGSSFRERVTAEQFRSQFEEVRTALGALESRALSSTQRLATLPDAPPRRLLRVRVRCRLRAAAGYGRAGHRRIGSGGVARRRVLHRALTARMRKLLGDDLTSYAVLPLMFGLAGANWPFLPDRLPIHWSSGEARFPDRADLDRVVVVSPHDPNAFVALLAREPLRD